MRRLKWRARNVVAWLGDFVEGSTELWAERGCHWLALYTQHSYWRYRLARSRRFAHLLLWVGGRPKGIVAAKGGPWPVAHVTQKVMSTSCKMFGA